MLRLRQQAWGALCAAGQVPAFLRRWLDYAQSLPVRLQAHPSKGQAAFI